MDLQEEMKRKETRWTNSQSRLRSKLEQVEQENTELKDEIKLLEKKRLEWMQQQNKVNIEHLVGGLPQNIFKCLFLHQ